MVLLGHIFIAKAPAGMHYPFCEIIYSFHMSLFFFVSGFLAYKTNQIKEKGIVFFIKKRAISLLTPYLFWLFIAPYFIKNSYPTNIGELMSKFYFIPNLNYWFLPLLFIFNIILFLYIFSYIFTLKSINVPTFSSSILKIMSPDFMPASSDILFCSTFVT